MQYVAVCLALLAAGTAFNLSFTANVLRRVRVIETTTAQKADKMRREGTLSVGSQVKPFEVTTTDGRPLTNGSLGSHTLVALLMPGCSPCERLLPDLVERARTHPGGRDEVLAVLVSGEPSDVTRYTEQLHDVAQVVTGEDSHMFSRALGTTVFPVLYLLDGDGRVTGFGGGENAHKELPAVEVDHAG